MAPRSVLISSDVPRVQGRRTPPGQATDTSRLLCCRSVELVQQAESPAILYQWTATAPQEGRDDKHVESISGRRAPLE